MPTISEAHPMLSVTALGLGKADPGYDIPLQRAEIRHLAADCICREAYGRDRLERITSFGRRRCQQRVYGASGRCYDLSLVL